MLVVDTRTDETRLIEDSRCHMSSSAFVDERGDFYQLGDAKLGYYHLFGTERASVSSCVLRITAGQALYDGQWKVDVIQVTGAPGVSGMWPVGGRQFVTQVLDPSTTAEDFTSPDEFWDKGIFSWALGDLDGPTARPFAALPKGNFVSTSLLEADGKTYFQLVRTEATAEVATLYSPAPDDVAESATTPGIFIGMGRVR